MNEHITETMNGNEMPTNISLSTLLILTCLPHPPDTSSTHICISAQDQNPNLIIPYINSTGYFLGSSTTQDISCNLQKLYAHYCTQKPSIHNDIFLVTETPALYTHFLQNLLQYTTNNFPNQKRRLKCSHFPGGGRASFFVTLKFTQSPIQ